MVQAVIATTVTGLQGRPVANTAPTTGQALAWNGSAYAPAGPFLTAAGAPYIATNYVDNSGFAVNQRGYSSGTALAAGTYGIDRWKAGASGCTLTFTASPASTVVTISAGTLQQVIEGLSQINASYTLSWLGSATGRINTGTYVASPITFTGAPNTNVTIEFQGGTLGQVQLQIGSQATLWQPTPPAELVARCQRFYQTGLFTYFGYAAGTPALIVSNMLPVLMRTTPTITYAVGGTPSNANNVTVVTTGAGSVYAQAGAGGASGGFGFQVSFTASADL